MFIEPSTALQAGGVTTKLLWQHRSLVVASLKKLHFLLTHGKRRILMFGPSGGGKTTLGTLLSSKDPYFLKPTAYKPSLGIEHHPLPGDLVCTILTPPGQPVRRPYTWPELFRDLEAGKSAGVINVVSFGYSSFEQLSYTQTEEFESGMTQDQFFAKYLGQRREGELDVVRELTPRLCDAKNDVWMITLVTKQDLWWNDRNAVRDHYMSGEYDKYIRQIQSQRGAQHFSHEYLSASLGAFVKSCGNSLPARVD